MVFLEDQFFESLRSSNIIVPPKYRLPPLSVLDVSNFKRIRSPVLGAAGGNSEKDMEALARLREGPLTQATGPPRSGGGVAICMLRGDPVLTGYLMLDDSL